MCSVMQPRNRAGATMTPALSQRPWSTGRRFTPIRRWAGGLIRDDPGVSGHLSYRSSLQVRSGDSVPFPVQRVRQIRLLGNDTEPGWPWREAGVLLQLNLLPPPSRLRPAGMIRFLRLMAAFRFRSCRVPQLGQVHVRSRFSFGFTLPQALQVRPLGNHMGRVTWVWRHWPLASSSRAYPRHLARALDFPGSAPGTRGRQAVSMG